MGKILGIALMAGLGAVLGYGGVAIYGLFMGGSLTYGWSGATAMTAAGIGAIAGGVIALFRRR